MTQPTDAEILRNAAGLIETKGWFTNAKTPLGSSSFGCFCLATAISQAAVELPIFTTYRLYDLMVDHLGLRVGSFPRNSKSGIPLVRWNDEPDRKKPEVIAALRELADKLEAA